MAATDIVTNTTAAAIDSLPSQPSTDALQCDITEPQVVTIGGVDYTIPAGRTQIIVNHLAQKLSEEEFLAIFEQFGPVDEARIMRDRKKNRSKGYGFIYFQCAEDAALAKERMDGFDAYGKEFTIGWAEPQRPYIPGVGDVAELQERFELEKNAAEVSSAGEEEESSNGNTPRSRCLSVEEEEEAEIMKLACPTTFLAESPLNEPVPTVLSGATSIPAVEDADEEVSPLRLVDADSAAARYEQGALGALIRDALRACE